MQFTISNLKIEPPLILAPMAGITHVAFRQLIASFGGCGLYFSEMIAAHRVPYESITNSEILFRLPNERPFFYQIMGSGPEEISLAVEHVKMIKDENGQGPDGIDINMGCGAPAIRKFGSGAALLNDPARAKKIVSECRKRTNLPLTVKMRLGGDEDSKRIKDFALSLQDEGIDAIFIHPRLIKEHFKRMARWQFVKELKETLAIPVIGNGDIETVNDIDKRFKETGCDGIMIGRAAVTKPWIFSSWKKGNEMEVDKKNVYLDFIKLLDKFSDPKKQLGRLKLFSRYYQKNFLFGHHFEMMVKNSPDMNTAIINIKKYFEGIGKK